MSILELAAPIIGSIGSTLLGNVLGRQNSAYAFDRSQESYNTRYQQTVADMRKAGLNPILAATGGFSVGGQPQMQMPSIPNVPDLSTAFKNYMEGSKVEQEKEKLKADTVKTFEEAELVRKKVKETIANEYKIRTEGDLNVQNEKNKIQEMFNLEQDFYKKAKEIALLQSQIGELESRQSLQYAESETQKEMRKKLSQETKLLKQTTIKIVAELSKLKQIAKVYDGPAGLILGYLQEILHVLNIGVGIMPVLKSPKLKILKKGE